MSDRIFERRTPIGPSGFSLVEVMIALGVASVSVLATVTLMNQVGMQNASLKRRVEFIGYQQLATSILGKDQSCSCNFTGLVFNEAQPNAQVNVPSIKYSCAAGAPTLFRGPSGSGAADVALGELYLSQFNSTGNSNEYTAQLMPVAPLVAGTTPMKPIPVPIRFYTDPLSPSNQKIIKGCGPAPLTVPTGLTAVRGNAQCSLSWQESSGGRPITYYVRLSTIAGSAKTGTVVCQTTALGCIADASSGIVNGTTYYLAIQAANLYEATGFSTEVTCRPLAPASVPSFQSVAPASANSCALSWSASTGTPPNAYELRQSNASGQAAVGPVAYSGPGLSTTVAGLTPGQTYYFAVNATNDAGPSAFSAEVSCTPPNTCPTKTIYVSGGAGTCYYNLPVGANGQTYYGCCRYHSWNNYNQNFTASCSNANWTHVYTGDNKNSNGQCANGGPVQAY